MSRVYAQSTAHTLLGEARLEIETSTASECDRTCPVDPLTSPVIDARLYGQSPGAGQVLHRYRPAFCEM